MSEHDILAVLDIIGGLGVSGILFLIVALFIRGDLVPRSLVESIIVDVVDRVLDELRARRRESE